jgi:hypothetical protein
MILALQIAVALIFFANKILILCGKKSGWLVGAFAAVLAIFYFYYIELYIYTVGEAALIVLMFYGFFKDETSRPTVEVAVQVVTAGVMLVLTWFAFNGYITIVELASALLALTGAWLIASGSVRIGWAFGATSHMLAAHLGYYKEQTFFADFQIASAVVSGIGAYYGNLNAKE